MTKKNTLSWSLEVDLDKLAGWSKNEISNYLDREVRAIKVKAEQQILSTLTV